MVIVCTDVLKWYQLSRIIFLRKTLLLKLNMSISCHLKQAFDHLRHKKLNTVPEFNNMLKPPIG